MNVRCRLSLLAIVLLVRDASAYFANWGDVGRAQEPTCVDIPANISLCSNIQYKRMRLPNLLAHDTLAEVAHQSSSWVPLLNVGCHPDTQLFLCSLFTPVCLESPIYPCRSLCNAVQTACEKRMTTYGYHWPDMLGCHNFPEDNDMCVTAQHTAPAPLDTSNEEQHQTESPAEPTSSNGVECGVCSPVPTYENILDHFCRADFVLRARLRNVRNQRLVARKARVYKPAVQADSSDQAAVRAQRRALRRPTLQLTGDAACCQEELASAPGGKYIVMGANTTGGLVPTFILPWSREQSVRDALRVFTGGLDCSDPSLFTPDLQSGAILNTVARGSGRRRGRGEGRRRGERRRGNRRRGDRGEGGEDVDGEQGGGRRGRNRSGRRRNGDNTEEKNAGNKNKQRRKERRNGDKKSQKRQENVTVNVTQ